MELPQVIFCHDKFNINVYHAYFWARFEGLELGLGQVGSLRDFIAPSSPSEIYVTLPQAKLEQNPFLF